MNTVFLKDLLRAADARKPDSDAKRIFFGPSESREPLGKNYSIDQFGDHYWITHWGEKPHPKILDTITFFLEQKKAQSAALLLRPPKTAAEVSRFLFKKTIDPIIAKEHDISYWIQFHEQRQPGLFLDHAPLRKWLIQNSDKKTVLNTFCYTASLSMAALKGNAQHVTNVDVSSSALEWAKKNHELNAWENAEFLKQDTLFALKRFLKQKKQFDTIILDPPSFSHSKAHPPFSIEKNLPMLIQLSAELIAPSGHLIVSTNCDRISEERLFLMIKNSLSYQDFCIVGRIQIPQTFALSFENTMHGIPKGYLLRKIFS
jgi:23S rRNA G2069 N7-methylase RlmK/C1962 C5-methylase RlmI